MPTIAIALIHGIGTTYKGYSNECEQLIRQACQGRTSNTLVFEEIYWSDLLSEQQEQLLGNANYHNDLDFMSMRKFFVSSLGDAIAYQPLMPNKPIPHDDMQVYEEVHKRVGRALDNLQTRTANHTDTVLVLMGHSLGSVVLSNYIWDNTASDKPLLHKLIGFITFGSPLALWALRYKTLGTAISFPGKYLSPAKSAQAQWLNYYDEDDVIAYPLKNINESYQARVTKDIPINVGTVLTAWNPICHTAYWTDKDFINSVADFLVQL